MSWVRIPFEEIYFEPSRNGIYKSKEFHGKGAKIVNMGELFGYEFIGPQEMKRVLLSNEEQQKACLEEGDLLFGRRSLIESGAGKCSIIQNLTEPTTFESSLIRVRLKTDQCCPKFYYYWFRSPVGRGLIRSIVTGTNVKGIRGTDLKKIPVVRPEKDVQEKIASILSAYDDLIENNRRRIELLEESARLLYQEWFVRLRFPGHENTKIIDGVPEGWKEKSLNEIATITMGQSPKSEFYNTEQAGLPFHQGVTNYGFRFVDHKVYSKKITKLAEADSILLSVRAPVGRINLTSEKIVLGRGLCAINSRFDTQSFLFYQLKSFFFKEDIMGNGAIFSAVTKKDMESLKLLIPSEKLVNEFQSFSRPVDYQIKNLCKQIQKLAEARDLLLPRLMSGEIEV